MNSSGGIASLCLLILWTILDVVVVLVLVVKVKKIMRVNVNPPMRVVIKHLVNDENDDVESWLIIESIIVD